MNLFRSEEHVARWLEASGYEAGETITARKLCDLAHAWWSDRLAPEWRPHTRDENQSILEGLGMTGSFWQLPQNP
jgi:hypothetical protein